MIRNDNVTVLLRILLLIAGAALAVLALVHMAPIARPFFVAAYAVAAVVAFLLVYVLRDGEV